MADTMRDEDVVYRDALPLPAQPSCPLCGSNEDVDFDWCGRVRVYLCGGCWTVFDGSPGEWDRMRSSRERRTSWVKNRRHQCPG